jgi:hypothetical protein
MAKRKTSTPHAALRVQQEVDTYNRDYLRRFWNARRDEIMSSGDPYRIRLLAEHDERERKRTQ